MRKLDPTRFVELGTPGAAMVAAGTESMLFWTVVKEAACSATAQNAVAAAQANLPVSNFIVVWFGESREVSTLPLCPYVCSDFGFSRQVSVLFSTGGCQSSARTLLM